MIFKNKFAEHLIELSCRNPENKTVPYLVIGDVLIQPENCNQYFNVMAHTTEGRKHFIIVQYVWKDIAQQIERVKADVTDKELNSKIVKYSEYKCTFEDVLAEMNKSFWQGYCVFVILFNRHYK